MPGPTKRAPIRTRQPLPDTPLTTLAHGERVVVVPDGSTAIGRPVLRVVGGVRAILRAVARWGWHTRHETVTSCYYVHQISFGSRLWESAEPQHPPRGCDAGRSDDTTPRRDSPCRGPWWAAVCNILLKDLGYGQECGRRFCPLIYQCWPGARSWEHMLRDATSALLSRRCGTGALGYNRPFLPPSPPTSPPRMASMPRQFPSMPLRFPACTTNRSPQALQIHM